MPRIGSAPEKRLYWAAFPGFKPPGYHQKVKIMSQTRKTTLAGPNNLKPLSKKPLSPLPPFKHDALRKLTSSQKKSVQQRLKELVNKFRSIALSEHVYVPPNKNTEIALRSLLRHLSAVCEIVNPKAGLTLFVYDQDNDHIKGLIQGFPVVADIMRRLVDETIKDKKYYRKPTAAKMPTDIACQVARLLEDYEIKPTVTIMGAWDMSTRYILRHGCGREETSANMKNILKDAKLIYKQKFDSPGFQQVRWTGINPRVSPCQECPHQYNMMPNSLKDRRFIFRQKKEMKKNLTI